MSVYTTVTPEELGVWLERYAVGTLLDLRGIAAGIENTNYFVTTRGGRYVLTLFEKLQAHELPFYLDLMAHLAVRGVPCPRPIPDCNGGLLGTLKNKPASLVTLLPGKDVAHPSRDHCAQVGALLAEIHRAGASYPGRMENPRGLPWWKAVMPEILPFLNEEDAALLRNEIAFQTSHRATALPQGAIHADLFRDNVLFEQDRLAGVIDFYFACTDSLLYDVAIAVNDWCMTRASGFDDARSTALLQAYAERRPFNSCERTAWPVMLRAAALRFWVSRLYDFHLPRPGELTHAKDPAHFRDILQSHVLQEHALP
jgi:homoserine kinase type II